MTPISPIRRCLGERPAKPSKNFPLFPHRCGQWCKKVRGRARYFGPWRDADGALRRWEAQKDDLLAGRPVRPVGPDELLVRDLCNHYLTRKKAQADAGEIARRTFDDYLAACQRLARVVGSRTAVSHLVREDFTRVRTDLEKTWGPVRVLNEIRRIRMVFTYGLAHNLINHVPLYGDGMKRPSAKILRKNRAEKGPRIFEPGQLRRILDLANPAMRAMILLAINCGYGNTDLADLERRRLDLKAGWADYPRPKTGVPRRCPLWPETVAAVRQVLRLGDRRPRKGPATVACAAPAEDAAPKVEKRRYNKLVFLSRGGRPWRSKTGDPISCLFGRLVRRLGIQRPGLGFYALRHTLQTIGSETKDEPAVSAIMGHTAQANDMSAVYRERIGDDRLAAVAEHVRKWLFGEGLGIGD